MCAWIGEFVFFNSSIRSSWPYIPYGREPTMWCECMPLLFSSTDYFIWPYVCHIDVYVCVSFDDDVFFSFLCCSNQQQNTNLIIVYIWFSHSVTVRVCCFVCLLYSLSFPSTFFLIILQIIILTQAAKHDSISAWCNSKQCHCGFLWFLVWNNRKTNRKETTE